MSDPLVLCYHAISPQWPAALSVTQEALERQLALLTRRGFTGTTFTRAALDRPNAKTLCVTFDDAFASVLALGRPVLDSLGLKGTVFAPTDFVSEERLRWPGVDHWLSTQHAHELMPMTWEQLQELAADGWEIGSHTQSHPHLTRLRDGPLGAELRESRRELHARLGFFPTSIAYPYGDVDTRVARGAQDAGYLAGAGLSSRLTWLGPLRSPRVGVYHGDRAVRFKAKVSPAVRRLRGSRLWRR